jgi:hypothetical protein
MFQTPQSNSLFLGGERSTGQDVRSGNGKNQLNIFLEKKKDDVLTLTLTFDTRY